MLRQCEHFLPSCTFYLTGVQIRKIEVESRDLSEGILAFLSASSLPLRPPPSRAWFSFPTLALSRARLEFSSSFSFWFLLLFPFPRSFPLFCFSSRDVSPSVVCILRFPPFTSSSCGNELRFRHVSFVCGIQPIVHFSREPSHAVYMFQFRFVRNSPTQRKRA